MYAESFDHDKIIEAFRRNVPGCYVRDYRDSGGYIVICKDYRDIKWRDQTTTFNVERQVPATTLVNLPRGTVRPAGMFAGLRLLRPGWRREFRRAMRHLSPNQMRRITKALGAREVFPGVVV
jgi:hypothetical protein